MAPKMIAKIASGPKKMKATIPIMRAAIAMPLVLSPVAAGAGAGAFSALAFKAVPHLVQNLAPSGFSSPHWGQNISVFYLLVFDAILAA
jgi:hypothetical protein